MPSGSNDDVDHDYQRALAVCALFRDDFSIDWLVDLLIGVKPSRILAHLDAGVRDGLLVKRDSGLYSFRDAKTRDKRRRELGREEQVRLHGEIAGILMREPADGENLPGLIAHHLLNIPNDFDMRRRLALAGDLHRAAFRNEEALQCYGKILDDLSNVFGEEEDLLFSETAIKYSKISTGRHDTSKVLSVLRSALKRAEQRGGRSVQAILKMHIAKNEWLRSRYSSALRHFEEGWSMAKELNDPKTMRAATIFSTFFHFWQGRFREAVEIYETSVPDIEDYPRGGFPLLTIITAGYCYAQIGQVTQGLGMLDAIRRQCQEQANLYLGAYAAGNIGNILLDIGRIDDAVQFLEQGSAEAQQVRNDWVWITSKISLAYAYYLRGEPDKALAYVRDFLEAGRKVQTTVYLYPYLMELCLAIKEGKLPEIDGVDLEKEIDEAIGRENIFMRGVAYRRRAILQHMEGKPHGQIRESMDASLKWLEESGSQVELAKSRLALARIHLAWGREEQARELVMSAQRTLAGFNEELVPCDLKGLVSDRPAGDSLLKEILSLGQQVVTIRDNKDLVQHILSTVNSITGAERGAIFLRNQDGEASLTLRASKNLTPEQIRRPGFASSMKLIEEVAASGAGRIMGVSSSDAAEDLAADVIRSRICVPMILRDKTVGVLYHDNRLLRSAFKEPDLELLSYFAALAAFALDNATAYEEIKRLNMKLSEENLYYREEHQKNLHFEDIVGESPAIKRVVAQVDQVTGADATVLITGETGVGKELFARAVHRHSPRKDKPFIRVHCSALPESLIPSELFGHEKGAFTGATRRRLGRFELADGGTLFLDEIGDLNLDIQVRLLRVLQTREFERVGGSETLRSDFRLVVATNRDLEKAVKAEKFRADLYYRLAVFPIHVPPLRERREDIPLLAYYFLDIYSKKMTKTFSGISGPDMAKLHEYHWPGNVRELENVIERGVILSSAPVLRIPDPGLERDEAVGERDGMTLRDAERRHILWALDRTGWKVRGRGGAAELLDLPASTLAFRMKKLAIQRPEGLRSRS
jgi:transcriptional regulator with GAF, ATPase, and Fis domain